MVLAIQRFVDWTHLAALEPHDADAGAHSGRAGVTTWAPRIPRSPCMERRRQLERARLDALRTDAIVEVERRDEPGRGRVVPLA